MNIRKVAGGQARRPDAGLVSDSGPRERLFQDLQYSKSEVMLCCQEVHDRVSATCAGPMTETPNQQNLLNEPMTPYLSISELYPPHVPQIKESVHQHVRWRASRGSRAPRSDIVLFCRRAWQKSRSIGTTAMLWQFD